MMQKNTMILAAGLGLRMRPLTLTQPKPLLSVWGKPLLEHILEGVKAYASPTIVVNTHYLAPLIHEWIDKGHKGSVCISHEPVLLDTGGGVRKALPWLKEKNFFVINGDILFQNSKKHLKACLETLETHWNDQAMDALLAIIPLELAWGCESKGDFCLQSDEKTGPLTRPIFGKKPYIFSGVQLVSKRCYAPIEQKIFSNNMIWNQAEKQNRLFGCVWPTPWFHIGTPEAFHQINQQTF